MPRLASVAAALALFTAVATASNVTAVITGYPWLENLWFDGTGNLFASDLYHGRVLRLTRDAATGAVDTQVWFGPIDGRVLGIAASPLPGHVAVNVMYYNGTNFVALLSTSTPFVTSVISYIPQNGNGLAYNPTTGWLYSTYEGDFLPLMGEIFAMRVDNSTGVAPGGANVFQNLMFCTDGAFVDVPTQQLYISSSVGHEILVYNVSNAATANTSAATFVKKFHPKDFLSLDDFCVTHNLPRGRAPASPPTVFAVDFVEGVVRYFAGDGSGGSTTVGKVPHFGTSVREPVGPGWAGRNSVFVTTGTLNKTGTEAGLYEVFLP